MTPEQMKIAEMLCERFRKARGRGTITEETPLPEKKIVAQLKKEKINIDDRELRKYANWLNVEKKEPFISCDAGYFYAIHSDEIRRSSARIKSQARAMEERARTLDKLAEQMMKNEEHVSTLFKNYDLERVR